MTEDKIRILLAVTDTEQVATVWQAAMKQFRDTAAELHALFVDDDRWRRAASLPFTREVSRLSGADADFTAQRAEEVNKDAVTRARRCIEQLAAEADLAFVFEVLPESDERRVAELAAGGRSVLIAPSILTRRPVCAHFARRDCEILLIEMREHCLHNGLPHRGDG